MLRSLKGAAAAGVILALGSAALAQGTSFSLGGARHDATAPVELSSDRLTVDQATGETVFTGSAVIAQGGLRLSADTIRIVFAESGTSGARRIDQLNASGGVTLVTDDEAAEAQAAEYRVPQGLIILTGDVLLTQGANIISGDRLEVDLNSGQGSMEGRVRTIIQPGR
ncbi:LptA/OstA family protein [Rhabdonatronobacter sediminivivens]|uniref:LptA/OstA family protein n=1 Tax=Rhabdonatronobacter sediminivivens TaxID=2743469 RepID=UPI001F35DEC3|nr:LptA/OstA family protein [Rhabdonatronobacter sediminivivens]